MSLANTDGPRARLASSLVRLAVGAIAGGGAIWLYYVYADRMRWSDGVAIVVALICFLAGARLFAESFNPDQLARRMQVEDNATPKEANAARLQSILLFVLGVSIVWPVIATLRHWPAPAWAYAVTAVFIAIRIGYTLIMWRKTDEFVRQRTKNVAWWTYFVSQTALIAYACAERLGLVSPVTAWDVMVLITATSIALAPFAGRGRTQA
jgi:hypothetical protein